METDWLPQGFDLIRQNHDVIDGEVIENALFSDGLFTFTLYVNKADSTAATENTWKQGAYTIYSEVWAIKKLPLSDSFQLPRLSELCKA